MPSGPSGGRAGSEAPAGSPGARGGRLERRGAHRGRSASVGTRSPPRPPRARVRRRTARGPARRSSPRPPGSREPPSLLGGVGQPAELGRLLSGAEQAFSASPSRFSPIGPPRFSPTPDLWVAHRVRGPGARAGADRDATRTATPRGPPRIAPARARLPCAVERAGRARAPGRGRFGIRLVARRGAEARLERPGVWGPPRSLSRRREFTTERTIGAPPACPLRAWR